VRVVSAWFVWRRRGRGRDGGTRTGRPAGLRRPLTRIRRLERACALPSSIMSATPAQELHPVRERPAAWVAVGCHATHCLAVSTPDGFTELDRWSARRCLPRLRRWGHASLPTNPLTADRWTCARAAPIDRRLHCVGVCHVDRIAGRFEPMLCGQRFRCRTDPRAGDRAERSRRRARPGLSPSKDPARGDRR